jgi:hypothetical protein
MMSVAELRIAVVLAIVRLLVGFDRSPKASKQANRNDSHKMLGQRSALATTDLREPARRLIASCWSRGRW